MDIIDNLTPEHVVRDIGQKLSDDITQVMYRNMALVADGGSATFKVAAFGAASALGITSGAFIALVTAETVSPEDAADAIWGKLRPSVVAAIKDIGLEHHRPEHKAS